MKHHYNLRKCLFRFFREDEGMVQFAQRIGVSPQVLYSWAKGHSPRLTLLEICAEKLGVHPAVLLWDDVPGNEFSDSGEERLGKPIRRPSPRGARNDRHFNL